MEELIKRINELAAKSLKQELTEEEIIERAELRKQYIEQWRKGAIQAVESIKFVDADGNISDIKKK